jgi:hypothetical protein
MSGGPMCIGCGKQFKSTRQLSSHAVQCRDNMSIKLTDSIYEKPKKSKSDKHSKKRACIEDSVEIIQDINTLDDDMPVCISFMTSHNIHIIL